MLQRNRVMMIVTMLVGVIVGVVLSTFFLNGATEAASPTYDAVEVSLPASSTQVRDVLNDMSSKGWVLDRTMENFLIFKK